MERTWKRLISLYIGIPLLRRIGQKKGRHQAAPEFRFWDAGPRAPALRISLHQPTLAAAPVGADMLDAAEPNAIVRIDPDEFAKHGVSPVSNVSLEQGVGMCECRGLLVPPSHG